MKKHSELSKDELSLLLFLECAAVDYGGRIDPRRMNDLDREIVKSWMIEGFIGFERIKFHDIGRDGRSHAVWLSDKAWEIAHTERRERNKRLFQNRSWETIKTLSK